MMEHKHVIGSRTRPWAGHGKHVPGVLESMDSLHPAILVRDTVNKSLAVRPLGAFLLACLGVLNMGHLGGARGQVVVQDGVAVFEAGVACQKRGVFK